MTGSSVLSVCHTHPAPAIPRKNQTQITRVSAMTESGAGGNRTCWCWQGTEHTPVLEPREQLIFPHSASSSPFLSRYQVSSVTSTRTAKSTMMRAVLDKQEQACAHPGANTDSKNCIWCQLGFIHRLGKAQTPNPPSFSRLDPDRVAWFWFW